MSIFKYVVVLSFLFLGSCETLDLVTRDEISTQTKKEAQEKKVEEKQIDKIVDKTVNKSKLFNTSGSSTVRPKIGLILGPGLALSLSHLGALKAINDQKIPIEVIGGLGWSSLIAANFALNSAVNDMRWKATQGNFTNAISTSFLRGSLKEVGPSVYSTLIDQYTRGQSIGRSKMSFICPAIDVRSSKEMYYKSGSYKTALTACMKVPPLAQSQVSTWAYVTQIEDLAEEMRSMGAEKIIFINPLPRGGMNWGNYTSSIDPRDKYFWSQVQNSLSRKFKNVDHYLFLNNSKYDVLDFKDVKSMIESSEAQAAPYFSKLGRTYSF